MFILNVSRPIFLLCTTVFVLGTSFCADYKSSESRAMSSSNTVFFQVITHFQRLNIEDNTVIPSGWK